MTGPDAAGNDGAPSEEALWRSIVDNYGDRPELSDEEARALAPLRRDPAPPAADPDDRFIPPDPPPLPHADPPVLLAWLGVLGAPVGLMVVVIFSIGIPALLGGVLAVWFLGGFAYLVSAMPSEPRDPGDDGAQI